ncbi:hypothetical protein GC177_06275 [bacterium]|nr:hypothetical protein [bacterium]
MTAAALSNWQTLLQSALQEGARAAQQRWVEFVGRIQQLGLIEPGEKTFAERQKETGYSSLYHGTIIDNHPCNPEGEKIFQHVEIHSPGIGAKVEPGDYIGIFPENDADEAAIILKLTGLDAHTPVTVTDRFPGWNDTTVTHTREMSLLDALRLKIDLVTPGMKMLELLANREVEGLPPLTAERQRALRQRLADGNRETIDAWRNANMLKDVLAGFYGIPVTAQELVDTREQLDQRRFTIAAMDGDRLSIIVSPIEYERTTQKLIADDPTFTRHMEGVANRFLRAAANGQELDFYIDPSHFGLPWKAREHGHALSRAERRAARQADMIFVGSGTGIAPYIPMMQELKEQGHSGHCWLITGNRTHKDLLCADRLEELRKDGTLDRISFAASREEPRRYVQDIVRDEGKEIWDRLQRGAYVYIYGDRVMGRQVMDALEQVAATHGGLDGEAARHWREGLEQTGHIQLHTYRQSMEFERAA